MGHIHKKWVKDQLLESKRKGRRTSRGKSKQQPTSSGLPSTLHPKGEQGIRSRMRNRVKHYLEERRKWIRKQMGIDEKFYQAYLTTEVKGKASGGEPVEPKTAAEVFEVCRFNLLFDCF